MKIIKKVMQQGPKTYYLKIGEIIICPEPSIISTVLGSCVSVCLFAKRAGIGGMIHFVHPKALTLKNQAGNYKYGEYAIPALIRELEKLSGVPAQSFTAKIVGGANEIYGDKVKYDVGSENIKIAKEILSQFKINIISSDVGGMDGRKVRFHTSTNRLQVAPL